MIDDPTRLIDEIVAAGGTVRHIARCVYVSDATVYAWRRRKHATPRSQVLQLQYLHRLVGASVGVADVGEAEATPTENAA